MNIFLRNGCVSMILMGLFVAQPLFAKEVRIGFVKIDRIFKEAQSAKEAEVKLTQEFSKRQKEIADRETEFKSAVDKFEVDEPTLAESDRLSRQKRLGEQDRALQLMRRNFQEDLAARKNEELQQLLASANKIIKQTAEDQKYDVIFQDAVYVNPKYDITDSVIKTLDAQSSK
jgi:outer membrane protein